MTSNVETQSMKKKAKPKPKKIQNTPQQGPTPIVNKPNPVHRLHPSASANAIAKKSKKSSRIEHAVQQIQKGYKVLVLLRGLPGSGKSHLARLILESTIGSPMAAHHILSTDDFFSREGRPYLYNPAQISEAHNWNQRRAFQAMSRGFSPVIIDNTNLEMWEMKPYAMMAIDYGYIIELIEPDTFWAFDEKELARRNQHGVLKPKIREMLMRYDKNVTTQKLLNDYNLVYKYQKPPQFRLVPPLSYSVPQSAQRWNMFSVHQPEGVVKSMSASALNSSPSRHSIQSETVEGINLMDFTEDFSESKQLNYVQTKSAAFCDDNPVDQILMYHDGEDGNILKPAQISETTSMNSTPKKPFPIDIETAWGVTEKALHTWDVVRPVQYESSEKPELVNNEFSETIRNLVDGFSNVDVHDFDYLRDIEQIPVGSKLLKARSRDINESILPRPQPIPKKIMVHQSCCTEDLVDDDRSFTAKLDHLKNLFPKIPKAYLKDLFEKCNKDFNWTVDVLLEDNNHADLDFNQEDSENMEEENEVLIQEEPSISEDSQMDTVNTAKSINKNKITPEEVNELKKCIESKIDINKSHYSEHVLKVKQTKFGAYMDDAQPSTSALTDNNSSDSEEEDYDNPKDIVELNLGEAFVSQLEIKFGHADFGFPQGFQPIVQVPVDLARQLYMFYIESVCQQMENQNHILDRLTEEDEEFAKKLQAQEQEHFNRETVPDRPMNFSEIMDEQVAANIYKRDIDNWKDLTADTLAAKLTRQKLFDSFPNVDQEAMLEILHANNNDYNRTVEDLLASVDLKQVNGAREAIVNPPLSQTTIQEMKDAEEGCTAFEESEQQQSAVYYREKADKFLQKREQLYQKAQSYYQKGMTEVAGFYSELAKKETQHYDTANHLAAAYFLEEHAQRLQKFDTIDLHYLYVKEAMPALDLFLDKSINLLRSGKKSTQELFVITGRGNRSHGGTSKIKPAVMTRLKKRQIHFVQMNPGLLKARINRNSLMSSDSS